MTRRELDRILTLLLQLGVSHSHSFAGFAHKPWGWRVHVFLVDGSETVIHDYAYAIQWIERGCPSALHLDAQEQT